MFAGYFSMEYNQNDYELQLPPEYLPPEDINQSIFCYNQFFQNIQKNSKKSNDSNAKPPFKSNSAHKTTSKSVNNDQNDNSSNDFLLLAEGCELEGPIPRLVIPCNGNGDFDLDLFVISLLSVDSQTTKFDFTMHSDSQVFMSQTANNIHAFVEYFTLYDSMARGFVRPFCLAYCSSDHNKLLSRYPLMANELSRMVSRLKASNCYLFFTDMSHALSDLQYTREKLKEMTETALIEDDDTNEEDENNKHIQNKSTDVEHSINTTQAQAITAQPTKTIDTINSNTAGFLEDSKVHSITHDTQHKQSNTKPCDDFIKSTKESYEPNKLVNTEVGKPPVNQKMIKNPDDSLPSFIRVSDDVDTSIQDSTLPTNDEGAAMGLDIPATEPTKTTNHNKKLSKKLKEVEKTINEVRDILQALNKLLEGSEVPMVTASHPATEVPVRETPLDCVNFNLSRWLEEEAGKKMVLEDFDPSWYKWTRKQDSYEPRLKTSLKAKNKRHLRTFNDLCGVDGIDGLHALFKYLKRSELTLYVEGNDIQDIDPPEGLLTIGRTVFLNFLANFSNVQVEKKATQMHQSISIYSPISNQPTRWLSNETLISFHTCPSPTLSAFNNEEDDEDCYYNSSDDDDDVITAIDTTISNDNDSNKSFINNNDEADNNDNNNNDNNNNDNNNSNNDNNNEDDDNINNQNNNNSEEIKSSIENTINNVEPNDSNLSPDVFTSNKDTTTTTDIITNTTITTTNATTITTTTTNNNNNNNDIFNQVGDDNNTNIEVKRPQSLFIDGRSKNNNNNNNNNNNKNNNNNSNNLGLSTSANTNTASRASIVSIADHLTNLNSIKGIGYGIWRVFKLYPEIAVHFSFSLLIGRPLIIYTTSPNHEIAIKKLVTALWMFVPGYYSVTRWCQTPLHLKQLEHIKLLGLCRQEKKSFENMIPNDLQEYITVFNFERRTLSGPRYKDGILLEAIQKINSFQSDVSYAAYLHSVLFNLVNKAFIYFHAHSMTSSSSSSSSSWLSRKKSFESSESFLTDHLLLTPDDAAIVKYLSQIVSKQILNASYKTRHLYKLDTHETIKGAF